FSGFRFSVCQGSLLGLDGVKPGRGAPALGLGYLKLHVPVIQNALQPELKGVHGSWDATAPNCCRVWASGDASPASWRRNSMILGRALMLASSPGLAPAT